MSTQSSLKTNMQSYLLFNTRYLTLQQMGENPNSNISSICVQALFNLTCVDEMYPGLDSVIKALIGLAPTSAIDPTPVTVTACCNCSNFFKLRVRMLEAGAVQVLTSVGVDRSTELGAAAGLDGRAGEQNPTLSVDDRSPGKAIQPLPFKPIVCIESVPASKDLAYHAAVCFHNMATARSCRSDMVIRGAAGVMVALSLSTRNLELLHCVAATLQKLTLDVSSVRRIIKDGAVRAIENVVNAPGAKEDQKTAYQCALTLYNLSAYEYCVDAIVAHGVGEVYIWVGASGAQAIG